MNPQNKIFQIRKVFPEDLPEICLLAEQLGYPDLPEKFLARLESILITPTQEVFVAQNIDSKVIGFIYIRLQSSLLHDPFVEIVGMVVDQGFRRLGIGKVLLAAVEDWTKYSGCNRIRLHSNTIRGDAHKFYTTQGYSIMKTQYSFIKDLT